MTMTTWDSSNRQYDYDIIIIGGRPAGATLAARLGKFLGKAGVRILLLERQALPSLPAVSCPIIYSSTMTLLDEIGANEADYAYHTPKIERMVQVLGADAQTAIRLPESYGRDYAYAIDRARFDAALWDTALRYPTVTGWQGFNVSDLLMDGDKVIGVIGRDANKQEHRLTARLVVGADGRFSLVARKCHAHLRDEHAEFPATIYYAYWKNLKPYDHNGAVAAAYAGDSNYGYLLMDSAFTATGEPTAVVAVEGQAAFFEANTKDAESLYLDLLRRNPLVWERLENAERVTTVRGMKRVGNSYRQPGGDGWGLVGDAYHQKDPLDGQGIYNAVFSAKALAYAIRYWHDGEMTWANALDWYDETVRIKTYSTYKALITRIENSFYTPQPDWMVFALTKWVMDDPGMQDLMGKFITRQIPADVMQLISPPIIARAVVRGGLRDLRERLTERVRAWF